MQKILLQSLLHFTDPLKNVVFLYFFQGGLCCFTVDLGCLQIHRARERASSVIAAHYVDLYSAALSENSTPENIVYPMFGVYHLKRFGKTR